MNKITYEKSGVNIDTADATKREMAKYVNSGNQRVLNKVGAFASLYDVKFPEMKNPVLVLKTEEPGSKQKFAFKYNKIKNICYDMINHLTNDIIVMGATPLTVQDAIICSKIEKDVVSDLVKYISQACKDNGSVLTGGETSEQPDVVEKGIYVLTSSIVGIVEKDEIIDGSKIEKGDVVIALPSNGIHTNGYSFIRMLMEQFPGIEDEVIENGETFLDVIMRSHSPYYSVLTPLFGNKALRGMAHITGGGIQDNLNRILPENLSAEIDLTKIRILPIFKFIKEKSQTDDKELLRTFNMGVGMTVVVKKGTQDDFLAHFKKLGTEAYVIGEIIDGNKKVVFKNNLQY
jgi:phosphoribosylformylglycinamidine cyclo-ligase